MNRLSCIKTIDIRNSITKDVFLQEFQQMAIEKLTNSFINEDKASGLLEIPTGGEKTKITIYFLVKKFVSQGYQVIWLTESDKFADKVSDIFEEYLSFVKLENSKIKKLKIACIPSEVKNMESHNNILIMNLKSDFKNQEYVKKVVGKKVVMVLDEAHNAFRKEYRKTIQYIRKASKSVKLLGLTSTPIRPKDIESKYLMQIFQNNLIYSVSRSELITKQILPESKFETIETGIDIVDVPSPGFIEKLAYSCERNHIIVETYMKNKDKYGKTLMFALNPYHCLTLCEELQKKRISCDYIDDSKENQFIVGKFDVLVTCNELSEHIDISEIKTIFITGPTKDEFLLKHMMEIGMKGKAVGGNDILNIVDFHDKYNELVVWLNPKAVIDNEILENYIPNKYRRINYIPLELLQKIRKGYKIQKTKALPVGWYLLKDKNAKDYAILVFEDQLQGFVKLFKDKKPIIEDENIITSDLQKYFYGVEVLPKYKDLEVILDNIRVSHQIPHLNTLEARKIIDPIFVSQKIKVEGLNLIEIANELYKEHEIIEKIFGSIQKYRQKIFDFINFEDKTF